uniref:SFRICE_041602 n=1 Tax=Spodoptera frugiperda TaxID=7108 RepID=A0A2H1X0S8_SPOFR
MDEESLIRIIVSAFSGAEITEAKNLLFDSVSTTTRNISRRKNKEQKDIEDIICLFKSTDPDKTPIFVARELQKLPPVTFDHVDVTRLLKDIVLLQSEVRNIKNTYATIQYVEDITTNTEATCNQSRNNDFDVSSKQLSQNVGARKLVRADRASSDVTLNATLQCSSEVAPPPNTAVCAKPLDVSTAHVNLDVNKNTTTNVITNGIKTKFPLHNLVEEKSTFQSNNNIVEQECLFQNVEAHKNNNMNDTTIQVSNMSMAEVVRHGREWRVGQPDLEWKEVQRRRHKNRQEGVKGKAAIRPDDKFKPAEIKLSLFLSNVHKDTSEKDIVDYIFAKTKESVSIQKIKMKIEKPYNAYKLIVNKDALSMFLSTEVWPDGVTCRRFRPYRTTVKVGE